MDKDRVKGSVDQAKGAVKEVAGKVLGDKKLETEGKADKAAGKVENAIGGIKDAVRGKIVVDAAVPLVPPKVSIVQLPAEGSAAQIAQRLFGDGVKVVSAFHNVGAKKLQAGERVDCDVLVFGDDKDSREIVIALAGEIGTRGVDGGVLANSVAAEALTSVLIAINRRYKVPGAGIHITGLPSAG